MTKRRVLAVLVALAMLIGGLPVSGLEANAAQKHCNNSDDCTVCTIAEMINDLPDAEDIDVYNAAAVVEQIHAIDRIKGKLSDDEYEEMIKLVEAGNDGSGYGVDVPTRYLEAVMAVNNLNAGGSLYAQKKYSVGDNELDWNKTDATLKIECIDKNTNFEPLKVTLANATDSYLGAIGAYNENADGWTNTYILPAGTYKITETRYNAVTVDGDKLTTTATYDVDGTETTDYAIVEVKAGEESSVSVLNRPPDKFFLPWTTKDSFVYGESIMGLIDFQNIKLNGQPYPNGTDLGTGVHLICKDEQNQEWSTENGAVVPVGKYTVTGDKNLPQDTNIYVFGDAPKRIDIIKRVLTEVDIEKVMIEDRARSSVKKITIEFKKEDPRNGYMGGVQNIGFDPQAGKLIYDDVKAEAVVNANADGTYIITAVHLTGASAGNYDIQNGGIIVKEDGTVIPNTIGGGTPGGSDSSNNDKANTDKDSETNTGDDFNLLLMMTMMLFTIAVMSVVLYVGRRRTQ